MVRNDGGVCLRKQSYTLNSQLSLLRLLFFVLFGTLKYKNGQKRAFLLFSSLKNGHSSFLHFLAFFMVFLPDFPGSYAIQYYRRQILLPDPQKISRGSSKNFSVFHEKFWPVSRDHFACHFKVIWPVPRFAFVPKWTKPQARENWAIGGRGLMGSMRLLGPLGLMGDGPDLEGLFGLPGSLGPVTPTGPGLYFITFFVVPSL